MAVTSRYAPRLSSRKYDENKIFEFIVKFKSENDGISPTIREIKEELSISSTSVVNYILNGLENAGRITRPGHGGTRNIRVVGGIWSIGGVHAGEAQYEPYDSVRNDVG